MKLPFIGQDEPKIESSLQLLPLTPNYDEANHKVYFTALQSALTGKHQTVIRNIALTGSYGVGKSSILQQVADTYAERVVQVSLSTLGPLTEESPPSEATTITNRIQKEIVKQLLYRENPSRTPGSRFRRIGRFEKRRGLGLAALVGISLTVLFILTGWTSQLVTLIEPHGDPGLWAHPGLFVLLTGFVFLLEAAIHNRLWIQTLGAGSATIALSDKSASYFDQYLDEIVYFFEVTESDIVIFEDIDRFDDPHIFETLRALNSLLSNAKQLDGRSVRFIYAIKDSIFDELGRRAAGERDDAAISELARANRTKFFDLVIPVVPFITHRSARDLVMRVMRTTDHNISPELFDLASRHITDMRLIKNVRNEFVIFREKVLRSAESIPGLDEDQLFAMMLYKSTHQTDFESIKSAHSQLDALYRDFRRLISENIARLEREDRYERNRASKVAASSARSEELGNALIAYISRTVQLFNMQITSRTYDGSEVTDQQLRSPTFWSTFLSAEIPLNVSVSMGRQSQIASLTRAILVEELGDPLSLRDWQESERIAAQERIYEIRLERELLSRADMGDLMDHEEFKLKSASGELKSFRELTDVHLDSELARQLVGGGYINKDFTRYTSTYYAERVSSQAMNFIVHNIEPNVADAHFVLTSDEVEEVLRERGELVLREHGIYNINVLDHLLRSDDTRADTIVQELLTFGEDEQSFLQAYLSSGEQQESLIRRIAPRWGRTLRYICSEVQADDCLRARMFNVALESLADGTDYRVDGEIRDYIEEHYSELPVFTSEKTTADAADLIARLLTKLEARLKSLAPLGPELKRAVIAASRYIIARDNLVTATGGVENLPLDRIREHHSTVYDYLLGHLSEYLVALRETEPEPPTIGTADAFEAIIEDVLEQAADSLSEVIASASPECQVPNLADVSRVAWPALAEHARFPATFENVTAYMESVGQVDAPLARLLAAAESISVPTGSEESDKQALAIHLLASGDDLSEPESRINLVLSLDLTDWLPATSIQPESGNLIGLLIDNDIVADDAESFALTLKADWPTRECAIAMSEQFLSFMTSTEVPASDIVRLIRSATVPDTVKLAILRRPDEFLESANRDALTAVAEYTDSTQSKLSISLITQMATTGVETQLLLRILESALPDISEADLVPILTAIGGEYEDISRRNGKRPKLPKSAPNCALTKRLIELGLVNSTKDEGKHIRLNMKRNGESA